MKKHLFFILILSLAFQACAQNNSLRLVEFSDIVPGDGRTDEYLPLLKDKVVAIVANPSSVIGNRHLVDTLLSHNIHIAKIFSPEHGFRGNEDAGAVVTGGTDPQTGIEIVSLYGSHKKPTAEDLEGTDIIVFDLQDVGARFYTYISTLTYVMEACAETGLPVLVLDRPNPNGFYIDGPVLQKSHRSFVGMHPVPIVYGMTIGEFALMINGEGWLENSLKCDLKVIKMLKYGRNMIVKLPVKPSPNLPDWLSVYLYPSLCLFEGTVMSVGRGTDLPFQVYGHPGFPGGSYEFKPTARTGATNPKYKDEICYGRNLRPYAMNYRSNPPLLNLSWLIDSFKLLGSDPSFFNSFFDKLAGTDKLRKQIISATPEAEIRKSWERDLNEFREIRKKYLIY